MMKGAVMKRYLSIVLMTILLLGLTVCEANAAVNLKFSPASGTYERNSQNGYYTVVVQVRPTIATAIEALGDIYLTYDSAVFEVVTSENLTDYGASYTAWEDSIVNPNYPPPGGTLKTIHYGKTNSIGPNWTASAGTDYNVLGIRFYVRNNAPTGNTVVYFRDGQCHIIDGSTHTDVLGTLGGTSFNIVLDNTAPQTTAVPGAGLYNAPRTVRLQTNETNHEATVHFTTSNWTTAYVTSDPTYYFVVPGTVGTVTITTLNYYAVDQAQNKVPNQETPTRQAVYVIDMQTPTFNVTAYTTEVLGPQDIFSITFTVSELLGSNPQVTVGGAGYPASRVSGSGVGPYIYQRVISGAEDGGGQVVIGGADLAGNSGTNSAYHATLDLGGPSFTIGTTPNPVRLESTLNIDVTSSEALQATPEVKLGDSPAGLQALGGLSYSYQMTVPGHGWLLDLGTDNDAPVVYDFQLSGGNTANAALNTVISFKVRDIRSGVASESLRVLLNGAEVLVSGAIQAGYTGSVSCDYGVYTYCLRPSGPLSPQLSYILSVEAADGAPSANKATAVFAFNTAGGESASLKVLKKALSVPTVFDPREQDTEIVYTLSKDADIELRIYDISGTLVWSRSYPSGEEGGKEGINKILWDGHNDYSSVLSNGVYMFYILDAGSRTGAKVLGNGKIVILKKS
jgi:hypothetical protein